MINFYDISFHELQNFLKEISQPSFRAFQIWEGIYQHAYTAWEEFTNLPNDLRASLNSQYLLQTLKVVNMQDTFDKSSTKFLFQLHDENTIESVILRNQERITLCISTQSGCPVGCVFCATGNLGYFRNLYSGEIIAQVIFLSKILKSEKKKITNVVLMGMGEPLLNYDATLTAIKRFNDKTGMNMGARRITLSTIGIPEKIRSFAKEGLQVNLAVSLHAPNDDLRQELVPLAKKYSLSEILNACQDYIQKTNRRVTFEYVLIADRNDHNQHAEELSHLLQKLLCHVNLIALNPTTHFSGKGPSHQKTRSFGNILLSHGISTSIRESQGLEIQAACGQLAGQFSKTNHISK